MNILNLIRIVPIYTLKNFPFVLFLYNSFYRIKNKTRFYKEIDERKNISIFDYKKLSKPIPFYPLECVKDSNFYGISHSLKEYAGLSKVSHAVEHGLYLGNYVPYASYLKTTKSIITLSNIRKKHLLNSKINKPVYQVGPYIHYAKLQISDNEFNKLKESLGKTLLLFPHHSIKNFNVNMDILKLIEKVKKIGEKYDTILVCVYYKDILNNSYLEYFEKHKFKVVTAGHIYDINFLSRLKLIIKLSDLTISNTVGTHTGYCIYLNKPHYIIDQEIKLYSDNNSKSVGYRNKKQNESLISEEKEILKEFVSFSECITPNQKKVVEKYWGISSIKQPEDLFLILKN